MVKNDNLSSDIDFIKEFEELKIKQKLLIESLKKKTQSEQSKLFLEINSKLDFLVKIFTEANKAESEVSPERKHFDSQFHLILTKVDELFDAFDEKINNMEKSFNKQLEVYSSKYQNKHSNSEVQEKLKGKNIDNPQNSVKSAPVPNFQSNIKSEDNTVNNNNSNSSNGSFFNFGGKKDVSEKKQGENEDKKKWF